MKPIPFILIISLVLINQLCFSQIKIGAKVGYSLNKLSTSTDNIYTDKFESLGGVDWGFLAEFPINDLISIQPEINFTQRGAVRNGAQPVPLQALDEAGINLEQLNQLIAISGKTPITDTSPFYATYNSEADLKYIEIPVLLKLGWGSDWRFYVEAGPSLGILLSANQITSGESQLYFDEAQTDPFLIPNTNFPGDQQPPFLPVEFPSIPFDGKTDIKDDLETISFGIQAGVGLIKIFGKSEVFFDTRTALGLTSIQKNSVFGESKVGGIIFSIGYAYTL